MLAEYNLGVLYEKGWGVAKDEAQAIAWYRTAAEQGLAQAQFNLGNMLRSGRGIPRNDIEALTWLRRAAEQGNTRAQYLLGLSYEDGDRVPKNPTEAADWYRKAAAQGDVEAQGKLAAIDADAKAARAAGQAGNPSFERAPAAARTTDQARPPNSKKIEADCTMIRAEIEANRTKVQQLANEQKIMNAFGRLVVWPERRLGDGCF